MATRLSNRPSYKGRLDRKFLSDSHENQNAQQQSRRMSRRRTTGKPEEEKLEQQQHHDEDEDEEVDFINTLDQKDRDLIYTFPSVAQPRSRRELLTSKTDGGGHQFLAFSSLKHPPPIRNKISSMDDDEEEQLHAGMSSAAACIVLELPARPTPSGIRQTSEATPTFVTEATSQEGSKRMTRSNCISTNISAHEMETWRNASGRACYRFKPVFTHHFFEEENIRGYRPTEEALEEARSVVREIHGVEAPNCSEGGVHYSFLNHDSAGHSLSVQVRLAPSCKQCCVVVKVDRVERTIEVIDDEDKLEGSRPSERAANSSICAFRKMNSHSSEEKDDLSSSDEEDQECEDSDEEKSVNFQQSTQISRKRGRDTPIDTPKKRPCQKESNQRQQPVRKCSQLRFSSTPLKKSNSNTTTDESEESATSSSETEGVKTRSRRKVVENRENQAPKLNNIRRSRRTCVITQQTYQHLYADEDSDIDAQSVVTSVNMRSTPRENMRQSPRIIRRKSKRGTRPKQPAKRSLYTIDESCDESSPFPSPNVEVTGVRRSSKRLVKLQRDSECGSIYSSLSSHFEKSESSVQLSRCTDDEDGYSTTTSPGSASHGFTRSGSQSSVSSSSSIKPALDIRRMKVEAIIQHISPGIPDISAVVVLDGESCRVCSADGRLLAMPIAVKSIEDVDSDYLDQPIGSVLREYSRSKAGMSILGSGGISSSATDGSTSEFVLCMADMRSDQDARDYHDQVEKIAPWFIEVADCVEMGSFNGIRRDGYWKVLYLFEKHRKNGDPDGPGSRRRLRSGGLYRFQLAGYMTLFYSSKRSQGTRLVVCQALLLPPYQKNGHGQEMMKAAYDVAHGVIGLQKDPSLKSREIIVEIDVESPAPAFVALRNRIDFELFRSIIEGYHNQSLIPRQFTKTLHLAPSSEALEPQLFLPLPRNVITKVSGALKITHRQVQIVYEIWKLGELEKFIKGIVNSSLSTSKVSRLIAAMECSYKSMIKISLLQHLRKNDRDQKFVSMDRDGQKELLEKLFVKHLAYYRSIVGKS